MNDLSRNKAGFSYTEKLNEYARNAEWQSGYDIVRDGDLITDANGNVDFAANENFSTLWYTVSAAFEATGNRIYDHITDLLPMVRDIDVCSIHALSSIVRELDVDDIQIINMAYPLEIEELMNLFSIPKNKLLLSGEVLASPSIDAIYTDASELVSGTMSGYVLSSDIWSDDQVNRISTISGSTPYISLSAWTNYIDTKISSCLLSGILQDGLVNELKAMYDANPENNPLQTPEDSDEIEDLKVQYGVLKDFHVRKEADLVIAGITFLHQYESNQQIVIQQEIDNRDTIEKFGDQPDFFRRFKYEREKKVREYIAFVENVNVYDSDYITTSESFYSSGIPVSFFAEVGGSPVSADLITNATLVLRNAALRTSYQRDYLKNIARKHAIIGTSRVIQAIVSEYIARNFSSDRYWGYHTFEGVSGPTTDISQLEVIDSELSSNILGDIRVIEYFDSTEYMNISAVTDPLESIEVNPRYWEGDGADISQLLSQHTSAEVSSFYANLGLDLTASEIQSFLNHVYDMGAVTATMYPEFGLVPYDLPLTGTFGDYGQWVIVSDTLFLSADVLPLYEYQQSIYYSDWLASPLISAKYGDLAPPPGAVSAGFLQDWISTPEASAWVFGMDIDVGNGITLLIDNSTFEFDNEDLVSAWIVNTYPVSAWVSNEVTQIWKASPLISRLSQEEFSTAWGEEQTISAWTSLDAITAPSPPFDRLDWASVPEYLTYIEDDLSGSMPTATQWASSEFVRSWNEEPFEIGQISIDFDQDVDWALSSNPFVSGWLSGDPFINVNTNSAEVLFTSGFTDQDAIAAYLYSIGAVSGPSGGYDSALSGMYIKYSSEPSGSFPPANNKNAVHPSIALQPYIWNLTRAIVDNVLFENVYDPFVLEADDLSAMIDENGAMVNMWRKTSLDFTGYQTFYEYATNLNLDIIEDERIDIDGPWNPTALKSYLDPISGVTSAMITDWYDHLNLAAFEQDKIESQLDGLRTEIESLSSKVIYQYAVDGFGNHYTLFKDTDEFDDPGELWVRYRNHPISFPLVYSDPTLNQVNTPDLAALSGVLLDASTNCYDFGVEYVLSDNVIWFFGNGGGSGVTDGSSDLIFAPIIEPITNTHVVSLERWPDLFSFTAIDARRERYVGTYAFEDDLVITTLIKPVSGSDESLALVSGGSYDTYTGLLNWDVHNISTGTNPVRTRVRGLKYAEHFAGDGHNPWKLTKGAETITIGFESEAPSASVDSLFLGSSGLVNLPFDPAENECSGKIYDNGITLMDFQIGSNVSVGSRDRDPDVSYYWAYTDVTYQGINGGNGIDTTPSVYDIPSGDCLKLQFFGNPNTSGFFGINTDLLVTCFNTTSGEFGIDLGTGAPTWESSIAVLSSWEELSGFAWEDYASNQYIFTYAGETFPSGSTISGYSVTYNGSGCHLFEICYTP
jgi:hypothetical protein